ncbi:hypothetical protein SEPCBS119000_003544 [Sporothrix epigloea]|uniref:SMODS and SLOG-associating 2TM effector domain-containing protein n=1 Tax=Sporothrix epigloea TaxID=1892477 RepID=A0ABP0DM86_9PEZI
MALPHASHDSTEQTPLLASSAARSRPCLPSLLPRCQTPDDHIAPAGDKGSAGATFPCHSDKIDQGIYRGSSVLSSSAAKDDRLVPASEIAHLPAAYASTSDDVVSDAWGEPAGLDPREANDENVVLFRMAVGIPTHSSVRTPTGIPTVAHDPEHGALLDPAHEQATGIYARILTEKQAKVWQASVLNSLVNACYVAQILVGAALTTLGPSSQNHAVSITVLGATNTVLAGVFALLKGQGLPDRLRKDAAAFRRVQDWIEETDALLVAGVVGRDRREVGMLVESVFRKYNAAVVRSEEARSLGDTIGPGVLPPGTIRRDRHAVGSGGVGGDGDADERSSAEVPSKPQIVPGTSGNGAQSAGQSLAKLHQVQVD